MVSVEQAPYGHAAPLLIAAIGRIPSDVLGNASDRGVAGLNDVLGPSGPSQQILDADASLLADLS